MALKVGDSIVETASPQFRVILQVVSLGAARVNAKR